MLAHAGVGSRRACEQLIAAGRVTVDGEVITTLGYRVDPARADIRVDGERVRRRPRRTFAVHKPRGVVSTTSDADRAPKVTDLVAHRCTERLYPVGRLDKESEGLMLLTNDGALAQRLSHPRHGVPKTYRVEVDGPVRPDELRRLERGVWTSDGKLRARSARIVRSGSSRKHGGRGARTSRTTLEIVLGGGRNRQLRRMLAKIGKKVRRLTRTAIGPVRLGDLKPGASRELGQEEIEALWRCGRAGDRSQSSGSGAP